MQAMEQEMKEAEVELKRRKEREEEKAERERSKTVIATPGRQAEGKGKDDKTPKRTPMRFGL